MPVRAVALEPRLGPSLAVGAYQDAAALIIKAEGALPSALRVHHQPAGAGEDDVVDVRSAQGHRAEPESFDRGESG
jgi:hypothetical protein